MTGGAASSSLPTRAELQRRTLRVLVVAQVFGGAGLAAGVSVGALLAKDLLGSTSGAGLPAALFTGGAAATAVAVGRLSDRHGRRVGLGAGYLTGAAGGVGVVVAGATDSVPLLLVALAVYGAGSATNLQCRYAGADLADPAHRGRAISTVLVATTVGAVAGPNLLRQTGELALDLGLPRLTGPFALAAGAYAVAGSILMTMLRPDPLLTARRLAADEHQRVDLAGSTLAEVDSGVVDPPAPRPPGPSGRVSPVLLAGAAMVLGQAVMVAVMTMTPVHLEDHHHGLGVVGLVIGLHIGAMYLPSPVTGRLVDRHGPAPVIAVGGSVLITSGVLAASSGDGSAVTLAFALVLLGLGWNLSMVGGTALVTAATPLARRARTQGAVDLGVALAGAVGGLSSGAIVAASSFPALAVTFTIVATLVLPVAAAVRTQPAAAGALTPAERR